MVTVTSVAVMPSDTWHEYVVLPTGDDATGFWLLALFNELAGVQV